ncbi:PepSY domain-containing protein [Lysobacter sp. D1-1-M9]|uniref:PepSY domain-containing protein n=1 Tax=Novilysobacter longmucuonensis TaxID=3098603 RepID=UPI002FC5FE57
MSTSRPRLVPLVLLATFTAGLGSAAAQHRDEPRGARANRARAEVPVREIRGHDRREDHRALSDAVRRVERRTGGQVLSAERVPFDGRDVNRVKVVDASGRVRIYMDDPVATERATGRPARGEQARTRRDDD